MPNDKTELLQSSIKAEEALLGALMLGWAVLDEDLSEISSIVKPQDFTDYSFGRPQRARVYEAVIKCKKGDIVSVANQLRADGKLYKNDIEYLRQLLAFVPTSYNWLEYAHAVAGYSQERNPQSKPIIHGGVTL